MPGECAGVELNYAGQLSRGFFGEGGGGGEVGGETLNVWPS